MLFFPKICRVKPNHVRDILSARSKCSKGCTYTREMIMVAVVSSMFARTRLRVGLASTPKRSLVELLLSSAVGARTIISLTRLGFRGGAAPPQVTARGAPSPPPLLLHHYYYLYMEAPQAKGLTAFWLSNSGKLKS